MGKKLPYTPASHIIRYVRLCWLRSRERLKVLKEANYTCKCGKKQSRAKGKEVKVQVHHIEPILWKKVIEFIRKEVLDKPQEVLCEDCHKKHTERQAKERKIERIEK